MAELSGSDTSAIFAVNSSAVILNTTSSVAAGNGTLSATAFAGDFAQSALTDPVVLSVAAAVLFVVWLLSLVTFFLLAKREYWPTFLSDETAAEYAKRVKWEGQPDERLRAMLLVKVHPSLLRLIAPEARVWIEQNWKRWTKDKPDWFTDRWKRGLPDTVLSQQALKELGGKNRRRSTLSEQLGVGDQSPRRPSSPEPLVAADAATATGVAPANENAEARSSRFDGDLSLPA
jgi:hypothetical protein